MALYKIVLNGGGFSTKYLWCCEERYLNINWHVAFLEYNEI